MSAALNPPRYSASSMYRGDGVTRMRAANRSGSAIGGEYADHRTDRMTDEDDLPQVEIPADLEHVVRVAIQRRVTLRLPGQWVGAPGADMIE